MKKDGPHTILIVDDELRVLKTLKLRLEKEGYHVIIAKDGEEGLKKALSKKPSLIILDKMMPKMDGETMFHQLARDPWGLSVPVIMLTNDSNTQAIVESVRGGITDYLVKTENSLVQIVAKVKFRLGE